MSEKCVRNHVCHTQDAQLRELRQHLADSRAQVRALEAVIAAQEELLVAYRMHNQKLAGKALDKLQRAREALRKEVMT